MREAMAAELEGKPIPDGNPNQWADWKKSPIQFDYGTYAEVELWWTARGQRRIEALARAGHASVDSRAAFPARTMVKS